MRGHRAKSASVVELNTTPVRLGLVGVEWTEPGGQADKEKQSGPLGHSAISARSFVLHRMDSGFIFNTHSVNYDYTITCVCNKQLINHVISIVSNIRLFTFLKVA